MLKFFLIALFVASATASRVTEDENVQLIVNGDESLIPEDLLDVNVIKIQDGNVVQSEKFYPIDKEQVLVEDDLEVIETPILARPSLRLETPVNVPADVSIEAVHPALPVPIEEPSLPIVLPDEVVISPVVPVAPIAPDVPVAPVEEIVQPILGELYNDGRVSVTVNAESEGIFARISSWMSMVINKFTGSSQEKVNII